MRPGGNQPSVRPEPVLANTQTRLSADPGDNAKPDSARLDGIRRSVGQWLLPPDFEKERRLDPANWVEAVFEPVAVVFLVAVLIGGLASFGLSLAPNWDTRPLMPVIVLISATAVIYTRRLGRSTVKPKEWAVMLVPPILLLRLIPYAYGGNIAADVSVWLTDARTFFSAGFVASTALVAVAWFASIDSARDLNGLRLQVNEVARERANRGYNFDDDGWKGIDHAEPMRRLTLRILWGGVALVFFAALAAIEARQLLSVDALIQIVTLSRPSVSLAMANAVLYFVIGLLLIAEGQLVLQQTRWRLEHLEPPKGVAARWLGQASMAMAVITAAAIALPTDYALSLSQLLALALNALVEFGRILMGIVVLLIWIVTWPLRALMQSSDAQEMPGPALVPPPVEAMAEPDAVPWIGVAQSLVFWLIVIGLLVYSLIAIGRRFRVFDGGIAAAILRPLASLWRSFVAAALYIGRAGRKAVQAISASISAAIPGRRTGAASSRKLRWVPFARMSPGQQIEFLYLSVLERAARAGFPRRLGETAAEYANRVPRDVPELDPDLVGMTASFEETRYGGHAADRGLVEQMKIRWQRIKQLLLKRRSAIRRRRDGDAP